MAIVSRQEAVNTVIDQAATELEPVVEVYSVEKIVDRCARADADGNAPSDDAWIPTYDLNAATAMAWERKAALTATSKFDLTVDGQTLSRSQVYDHCVAEAKRYRARIVGTVRRNVPENFGRHGYGHDVITKDSR